MAIIYLDHELLHDSSGLPEDTHGERPSSDYSSENPLLDLAPGVVYTDIHLRILPIRTSNITIEAVGFYPAFSPLSR